MNDTMRSPGDSVFVSALSHAPVPVVGIMKGVPVVVLKIFLTSSRRTLVRAGTAGER
uniref:Pco084394 n=1 Tax=Arundo donax TaxID=35708 RepID=A0A0A9FQH7_ARUDO